MAENLVFIYGPVVAGKKNHLQYLVSKQKSLKFMSSEAFELVRRSVVSHSITDDDRMLEQLRITCEKDIPPMRFLFRIYGKPCFPRGELVAVTGKAKSGKTLFNSILMASCVRENVLHVQRPLEGENNNWQNPPIKCLWYDTEQSEQSTQDILKHRILRMIENEEDLSECFDIFNVRSLQYQERLRLFEMAIRKFRPDLVMLDGIRDLLADINDAIMAQEVIERLMKLAQETDCCMVCVLHQNKGAEDRNLRGWIGTELMNKAFEVYSCEKVKPENIFVVEQTHTRKYDLGEMMFFRMDATTELPVVCNAPTRFAATLSSCITTQQPKEELPHMNREWIWFDENSKPHPKTNELFYEALKTGPMYYCDLQGKIQSLLNCGTEMWNNMFREMRDKGAIVRSRNKEGKSIWQLPVMDPSEPVQTTFFSQLQPT
jgi:hypothetical protein